MKRAARSSPASSAADAYDTVRFEALRGYAAAAGFAAVFLFAALCLWEWRIDPAGAARLLPLQLLASATLAAYPVAILARLSQRALPWLLYALLLAMQTLFLYILAHLAGGLARGGAGLLYWLLAAPVLGMPFRWRANLAGMLLLLALPNLAGGAFAALADFDRPGFNLLALPLAALALFSAWLTDRHLRAIHELRRQVAWREAAIEAAEETVHVTDRQGLIEYVNPAFTTNTGYQAEEVIGRKPALLKSGMQDEAFYENMWQTILRGNTWRGEIVNRRKDDAPVTMRMSITPVPGDDGQAGKFVAVSRDITEHRRLEEEVALNNAELEAVFNNAGVGIALLDLWGRFIKVNDFWLAMLGYAREDVAKLSNLDITHDDDVAEMRLLFGNLARGEIPHHEIDRRFVRGGGRVFWGHLSLTPVKDESGYIRAIIGIVQDINERKLLEDRLEAMAHYDALTGLPNRALFFDRLAQAISQSRRSQGRFALMFVDLDGFKAVNDTFGHDTGDAVLKAVSEHLLECVRESDTVARMGGDEFTLILRNLHAAQDAAAIAEKILAALAPPLHLLGHECRIGASIGIVMYPEHGTSAEELLGQADNAMYAVKKAGKNAYRFPETLPA